MLPLPQKHKHTISEKVTRQEEIKFSVDDCFFVVVVALAMVDGIRAATAPIFYTALSAVAIRV